jgi:hypothetical protein
MIRRSFPNLHLNFFYFKYIAAQNSVLYLFKLCSDSSLRLTVWGQRAKDFSIRSVYDEENAKPIIVLFVSCLAKHFKVTLP